MRQDLTELVCIIDRSGSMASTREAAEEGFNSFIAKQKDDPGESRVTLVQFDNGYEKIHDNTPIQNVGRYSLNPGGSTALWSAIKKTVREVGERLAKTPECDRPAKVIVVIVTDGGENASHYSAWEPVNSADVINKMITEQESVYSWKFIYIGSNQDAIATAGDLGIKSGSAMTYAANDIGTRRSYTSLSDQVSNLKGMSMDSYNACIQAGEVFSQADYDAQTEAGVAPELNKVS
jgi:hypothetical protein